MAEDQRESLEPRDSVATSQQDVKNDAGAAKTSSQQPPSSSTSTSTSALETKSCAHCKKPEQDEDHPLKPCAKCHTTNYCSRECQKADFKQHKKMCPLLAQAYAESGNQRPVQSSSRSVKEPHRGGLQKWQFDT